MSVSICSKCDNFARCRKYCPYKAGESLALMLANIPTMETKIGMQVNSGMQGKKLTGYKYCGIIVDNLPGSAFSPSDLAKPVKDIKAFESPFGSMGGLTAASMVERFINIMFPGATGKDKMIAKYYNMLSGREVPVITSIGDEIVMKFTSDNKNRQEYGVVKSFGYKVDPETNEIKYFVTGYNKSLGKTETYSVEDFFNNFMIEKYRSSLKYSIKDTGLLSMMNSGYIRPIHLKDKKHDFFLDGHNLIFKSVSGIETIIGHYNISGDFEEIVAPDEAYKNSEAYKVAKKIIPFISRVRYFIIPHGMTEDYTIVTSKYLADMKAESKSIASIEKKAEAKSKEAKTRESSDIAESKKVYYDEYGEPIDENGDPLDEATFSTNY